MQKNFKQARIEAKLTQTNIGKRMGITVQTVNKWERGRCPVARHHWSNLASLFNLSEDEVERILVQTMLDSCIERKDKRPLQNAVVSMLYRADLLQSALAVFDRTVVTDSPPSDSRRLRFKVRIPRNEGKVFERTRTPYAA